MTRFARIASTQEAFEQPVIGVPVVFTDGVGALAESVPSVIAGLALTHTLGEEWCRVHGLTAKPGSTVTLRSIDGPSIVLLSVGAGATNLDNYRLAGAALIREAGSNTAAFLLPADTSGNPGEVAQAFSEGALLSSYSYKQDESHLGLLVAVLGSPLPSVEVHNEVTAGVERGVVVASATNWAKRLIDTPPGAMTPKDFAATVEEALTNDDVKVQIWTESKLREERMGALLSVGQGSAEPCRLVYASYEPKGSASKAHIALVGKGITFDSGGLNLKPLAGMMTMKTDMSGAAIVMAVISAASKMKLPVRVTAIAALAENMTGERATKPGDVVTTRSGLTIEVQNPDAEGRLVLSDALVLAAEARPDAIIDIATLTGAQATALGSQIGGLFANSSTISSAVQLAGEQSGEAFWPLPLFEKYEPLIESDVADMKNMGRPDGRAGAIVAALLLQKFVDGLPWAHLDIAGPSRAETTNGYVTKGGTAFGTRALIQYLRSL